MVPITPGRYRFVPQSITEIRKQLGLTQSKMAALLGVEPNTLWRWENGKNVPDAEALAKIYSISMERGITPTFFMGKGLGRTRLITMWDFQNLGVSAQEIAAADSWIKSELNQRFPKLPYRRFKAFAHTSQSAATDVLMDLGWHIWEDDEDLDEDLIHQSLSDCGQNLVETIFVLVTKDGDYVDLLKELSEKGVRNYLIAPFFGVNQGLVDTVGHNRWIQWNDLSMYSYLGFLKPLQ